MRFPSRKPPPFWYHWHQSHNQGLRPAWPSPITPSVSTSENMCTVPLIFGQICPATLQILHPLALYLLSVCSSMSHRLYYLHLEPSGLSRNHILMSPFCLSLLFLSGIIFFHCCLLRSVQKNIQIFFGCFITITIMKKT